MEKSSNNISLAKNSVFNVLYNVLNLLFPLITSVYVSRTILPEGIGRVAYAQNITSYFISLAIMGLEVYGVREISKARENQDEKNKIFTELFLVNATMTMISTIAFVVIIFGGKGFPDQKLFMVCGIQLLLNFVNVDWVYRGQEEYVYIVGKSILIKICSIIAIFLLVKTQQDYITYAAISSFALAGNYFFNIIYAKKYVKFTVKGINLVRHIRPLCLFGITAFLGTIYSKLDISMLGYLKTNQEVGLYSNAFRLINIVLMLSTSITAVFLPRLSYCFENDREKFKQLLLRGIQVIGFITFPLMVGLVMLIPAGIDVLYGNEFAGAVSTVRILALLIPIKGFGDLLCYQLSIAIGEERRRIPAYILGTLANIVLNFILIPIWSQNGAALASVVSEFFLNLIQFIVLKKIVGYQLDFKYLLQIMLATIVMAICIAPVLWFSSNSFVQSVVGVLLGIASYFGFNLLVRNQISMQILRKLEPLWKKHI